MSAASTQVIRLRMPASLDSDKTVGRMLTCTGVVAPVAARGVLGRAPAQDGIGNGAADLRAAGNSARHVPNVEHSGQSAMTLPQATSREKRSARLRKRTLALVFREDLSIFAA